MSDDEEVQYVKKTKTVHYGSLEDAERARLEAQEDESNDSVISRTPSNPAPESNGNII